MLFKPQRFNIASRKAASRPTACRYGSWTMPKGYFVVEVEITDPAAYEAYRTGVPDIISAYGGKILVRGGDPQPLDGVLPHRRRVIVEFDSPEAVKTFYYSDAYQAVQPIRLKASKGFVCLLTETE
jgi:uncharacterized protein (DUF1330 family)